MVKLIRMECNWRIKSHSNHTQTHICGSQQSTIIAPEPQWKCYDLKVTIFLPTVPLSLSSLICSSLASPSLTKAARPALSRSPMSGAFSMALNAMPPYFIEHVVGWCWIPPQCLAMGSCIRDVSFGTGAGGGWREKYKRWGGPAHASLCFGGPYRSRCYFCISVWVRACCKEKSMSALTDSLSRIRALWVLLSLVYLTVAHWHVFFSQQVHL